MYNLLNTKPKDEIDLRELFATLWTYKLLIILMCTLSIIYAAYIALNTEKKFTSVAIFKLDQGKTNDLNSGQLGAIVNFTGLGDLGSRNNLPVDLVKGRVFVEKLDQELNFQADSYFNTYNPNSIDPFWKIVIKRAIGWQKSSFDVKEATWQGIVKAYSKNVVLEKTKDNSVKISVTHKNPDRAATIANTIMNEVITKLKKTKNSLQDQQLNYLSNTLAKALSDLEVSQTRLKEFALENGALPLENFTAGSLQLETLREQLIRTSELHKAVTALSLILKNKILDKANYLALRQEFPIIDQVEFRRILGQNEIITSWSWPKASSVNAVLNTLTERKSRLKSQIDTLQLETERLGLAVETYAKLEREEKIAEATYQVLIEHVKAQSMVAGFRPDKTEIYEYATASIIPSSPNRNLILILGATLGLLSGVALSLILALPRGVYFSKTSLKNGTKSQLTASVKSLLPLRRKSLKDINIILMKKPRSILRELAVEINKYAYTHVVITSSRAKMTGNDVARALSIYMQSDTMKIAVIDFSSKKEKQNIDGKKLSIGSFVVAERIEHLSVLKPDGDFEPIEMLSQKDSWEKIQSLKSTFDVIFLCANNNKAISLLSALQGKKMLHITLARTRKTKSVTLSQMRSLLPIQGLLHD